MSGTIVVAVFEFVGQLIPGSAGTENYAEYNSQLQWRTCRQCGNVRVLLAWCRHNRGVGIQTAPCHLGFEVENPKGFHAVWRDRILVVNDTDVAKAKRLDQCLHDLVMRDRAVCFRCHWCWHQGEFFAANRSA